MSNGNYRNIFYTHFIINAVCWSNERSVAKHSDRIGRARNKSDLHQGPGPHRSNLSWHLCLNLEKLSVRRFKTLFREKTYYRSPGARRYTNFKFYKHQIWNKKASNRDTFFFFLVGSCENENIMVQQITIWIHELWAKGKWSRQVLHLHFSLDLDSTPMCPILSSVISLSNGEIASELVVW